MFAEVAKGSQYYILEFNCQLCFDKIRFLIQLTHSS